MITAKNVRYMIDIPLEHIKAICTQNKIKGYDIVGAQFLGMTNGSEFCYSIVHRVLGGTDSEKMFLRYDPTGDRVTASIG
jgi:hypothetical protein